MQLNAALALGASVTMHVAWNLMARQQKPEAQALWWVLLAYLLLLAPWGLHSLFQETSLDGRQALLLVGSAAANALYFLSLRRAYASAPVALVYPLVRSSPLPIALLSAGFLQESLTPQVWVGIVVSVLGLFLMSGSLKDSKERGALVWAFIAMMCTCCYSITDRAGTQNLTQFSSFLGYLSFGYFLAWLTLTLEMKLSQGMWIPRSRPPTAMILMGGIFVGLAYALVIYAMQFMPVAVAVAYSNAGIVLACLISIVAFKESHAWPRRLSAALIICIGLFIIA
jgi:phosphonate utilization associated putative membrane protein